jgi:hypothetical protein
MTTRALRIWLFLPVVLLALGASAQTIPIDIEIGYRWLDLDGSEDMYRSQINEDSGALIRSFTLTTNDFGGRTGFLDHFRIDAGDLGSGPAGALRLDAGKSGSYRFNLRYRTADAFSALPAFANPLLGQGVRPGQHTFDRKRSTVDADVELLRWSMFKPFVGYSWNRYEGPGTTTYNVGQDEFLLSHYLNDTDRELRIGTGFELGSFTGQVTQGWRRFRGNESFKLAPGAGNGNNVDPVLGRPILISDLTRSDHTSVDTPFTTFYIAGQASEAIRMIVNFARFASDADGTETEDFSGSLASFPLSRFYSGLSQASSSRAKNTTWRGSARAEARIIEGLDVMGGFKREHRQLEGSALIDTLYRQSVTFGGADPRDVQVILESSNALERDEDSMDIGLVARPKGPFSFRAGFSQSVADVTVTPDLSEIVVDGGSQGGPFDRQIRTFDLGGTFTKSAFSLSGSWRRDRADDAILRTDFLDRDRYRLHAAWKAPRFVRVGLTADETRQSNDRPEIGYDAKIRQYGADIEVTPIEALSFRASASRFRADSTLLYRRPENFTTASSVNLEKGSTHEGGVALTFRRVTFDGGLSSTENEGTLPFEMTRSRARLTFQLRAKTGLAAEWSRDEYEEAAGLGDFHASRYGIYLRLTP